MSHPSITPAQAERLEMLAEECAEVIQEVTKILRHGFENYNPDEPVSDRKTNRQKLHKELLDIFAVTLAIIGKDLPPIDLLETRSVWQRKLKFTHHQSEEES